MQWLLGKIFLSLNFLENKFQASWQESFHFWIFPVSHHCKSFAGICLSIGNNCTSLTVYRVLDDWLYFCENIFLWRLTGKHLVKMEYLFILRLLNKLNNIHFSSFCYQWLRQSDFSEVSLYRKSWDFLLSSESNCAMRPCILRKVLVGFWGPLGPVRI